MIARLIYVFALLASALLLGLGMYLQYAQHLQSCGPQVLVRYALMLAALFALVALITVPPLKHASACRKGKRTGAGCAVLLSMEE